MSATFTRDFGTINEFYEIGAELMPGGIVQQVSEDEVIVRIKLPQLATHASIDERDVETVMRDVATNFQKIDSKAEINAVTDTLTNGVQTETVNVVEVSATSKLIPAEFMNIFNDFGGVYMPSVVWNVKTRNWNYEVIIYTK